MTPDDLRRQLPHTLRSTAFANLGVRSEGKVRDVYRRNDHLVLITTDRVSAFDRVLGTVPFKGEILNGMALAGFESSSDIILSHVLDTPHPNVMVARTCRAYPVEFVMRGYMTGSLYRDVLSGAARAYELEIPSHLERDERLPKPLLTPATKAAVGGHDMPTSKRNLIAQGALTSAEFDRAEEVARALFARGQAVAAKRGLILVDTKYELGIDTDGKLRVIDELHTPDSSRYWIAAEYEQRRAAGEHQRMLDKEHLRRWLMDTAGFSGSGDSPSLPDDIRISLASRYIEVFETLLGRGFEGSIGPTLPSLEQSLCKAGLITSNP